MTNRFSFRAAHKLWKTPCLSGIKRKFGYDYLRSHVVVFVRVGGGRGEGFHEG